MTVELWCVVVLALLSYVFAYIPTGGKLYRKGIRWGLSNRDKEPEGLPAWVKRGERAFANHKENFVIFAALVLVSHAAGVRGGVTEVAAQVFVVARILFVVVYVAGIATLRSVVFFAGVGATLVIALRLVGALD